MAITVTRKVLKWTLFSFPFKLFLNGKKISKIAENETITIPMIDSNATLSVSPTLGRIVFFKVLDGDQLLVQFNTFGKLYRLWPLLLVLSISMNLFINIAIFTFILSPFLFPIFEIKKIEASQENNPIKIE
ncbi:hypothetical protein [Streptococcus marimammalium]|uniref:hypothetical protein n=1 Tax=Streptococcus marimammalium TaxID=269666 RepID=UPI00037E16B4|nr:hypothetical protein [Streptococcus marimammalium]